MKVYDTFKMTIPNEIFYLPVVQLCIRDLAKKLGFADQDIFKIELGVEEVFMNVIEHAFEKHENNAFEILCTRIPRGFTIVVKEQGIPFDPNLLPHYSPETDIDKISTSGLGMYLTSKAFDDVSYHNLGAKGKETHLTKYLKNEMITEYHSNTGLENQRDNPQPAPWFTGKIDYDVRLMKPEEAIEVSRGAYKSHGYTLFDDSIYYPAQIVESNQTGKMISAVAVTKENVFMGHSALVYPYIGAKIAEMNFAFVNPEYRSQGCLGRLTDFLFTIEKKCELKGVYTFAVTNHVFSQKAMVKFGLVDCGIGLATSPSTWVFKGIDGDTSQRISVVVGYRYMKAPEPITLYAPERHRRMIEDIYGWMNVTHNYHFPSSSEATFKEEHSIFETITHVSEGCAEVIIMSYGSNILKEIKGIVRELCLKQFASITLSISLEDPVTFFITPEFEKIGFFFAGILPQSRIGDTLVLQYLNNVAFDYQKVLLYTDYGKKILAYIRECDPNNS